MGETLTTLISEDLISERVTELAAQIDRDYRDEGDLILIGVLKGSFVFLADLTRRLTIPHRVEFISISSYGDRESEDPGAVRLILDVRHDIGGRHVIVVEDIVDTGHTLSYLVRLLNARLPASLKTCRSTISGSTSPTCGWSATGWTSPSATGPCRGSAR